MTVRGMIEQSERFGWGAVSESEVSPDYSELELASQRTILSHEKEDIWRAVMEASDALSLRSFLPRLIASKLPLNWRPTISGNSLVSPAKITVPHRCPMRTNHRVEECITALLVEEEINRKFGSEDKIFTSKSIEMSSPELVTVTLLHSVEEV